MFISTCQSACLQISLGIRYRASAAAPYLSGAVVYSLFLTSHASTSPLFVHRALAIVIMCPAPVPGVKMKSSSGHVWPFGSNVRIVDSLRSAHRRSKPVLKFVLQ